MSRESFSSSGLSLQLSRFSLSNQRALFIGVILFVALMAFELFNFDTTQFALANLLGDVRFLGIGWATILAIAFCSIDFAGLFRLFTPTRSGESREVWYLMGAWLIGASMNAVMTWWAVSLTLLNHDLGNEVLSREQLLRYVPIFVAVLVWLTRILFIGAFSVTGEQLLAKNPGPAARGGGGKSAVRGRPATQAMPQSAAPSRLQAAPQTQTKPRPRPAAPPPPPAPAPAPSATAVPTNSQGTRPSRVRQRPPIPNSNPGRRPGGLQARGRN